MRAKSQIGFGAQHGFFRPYLASDVVDGEVEVSAEDLEGQAFGLASAAFLWGRGIWGWSVI